MEAAFTVNRPKRFGLCGVLLLLLIGLPLFTIWGIWIAVGIIVCIESLSVQAAFAFLGGVFIVSTGVATMILFMPFLQMNFYVRHVINKACGRKLQDAVVYDCQITFSPRLRRGLRGNLEDADDVGRFEVTGEGICFAGDSVQLTLPFEAIEELTRTSSGWRPLWSLGKRARIAARGLDGVTYFEIGERQSCTFWGSKWISDEIAYAIDCGVQLARAEATDQQAPGNHD